MYALEMSNNTGMPIFAQASKVRKGKI